MYAMYGSDSDEFDPDNHITARRRKAKKTPKVSSDSSNGDDDEDDLDSSDFATNDTSEDVATCEEEEDNDSFLEIPNYIIGKKDVSETTDIEYYTRFAGMSYMHCKYMTGLELSVSFEGKSALSRFNSRLERFDLTKSDCIPGLLAFEDRDPQEEYFQVDRIIGERKNARNGKTMYYVKWKNLGYEECTWEKGEDLKAEDEIQSYHVRLTKSNKKIIPSRWARPPADHYSPIADFAPSKKEGFELRAYQKVGVEWILFCYYNQRNSILADEMGLGKTAQIVNALAYLSKNEGINGPFLVVAPLSTLHQWKLEFERWSDFNAIIYHGNPNTLNIIREKEFYVYNQEGRKVDNFVAFDVCITNYDTIVQSKELMEIQWHYLVVDEAHRLKNKNSILYSRLKQISWQHCTLLTGTPIQNNIDELFNLLSFLDETKFNDSSAFNEKFGNLKESSEVEELRTFTKPYMLRRQKVDVETSILAKEETIIEVELTRPQKKFYKALISDNKEALMKKLTKSAVISLSSLATELRKVCNHPYLIKGAEDSIIEDKKKLLPPGTDQETIEIQAMVDSSGKLILIDKLLPKLKSSNHKVLIFSQWTHVLDILEDYLRYNKYCFERLDGSVKSSERQISIDRFNSDPNSFIFLISTRAGGVGINLTTADTVILFDSDWNPQNDLQAEARCHRIGQKRKVKVYRLVTRSTYESKMIEVASKKLGLDHVVLDGRNANMEKLSAKEIEEMLRSGVSSIFSEDNNECDQFCSLDIDQILEKRTKLFTSDVVSGGDSIFAKASFNANQDDLKLNAADFWKQVLPDEQNIEIEDDLIGTVRKCRKDLLSPTQKGKDQELNDAVNFIIDGGFKNLHLEAEVLRRAASSYKFENPNARKIIEDIVGEIPEECIFGNSSADARIARKSPLIIESTIFFYNLEVALYAAQNIIEWPVLFPSWEGPAEEYALMLALHRSGWGQLQNESSKNEYNLRRTEIPPKKDIEMLVTSLCSVLGSGTKCELDSPSEWYKKHVTNEALQKRSRIAVFECLSQYGISKNENNEYDWDTFAKKSGIRHIENIPLIGNEVLSFIEHNDQSLVSVVGADAIKTAADNIEAFIKIHKVSGLISNRKGFFNETPSGLPEWWTPSHSKYFIQNLSRYGLTRISQWIADKSGPFFNVIPASSQKSFLNAANREIENRAPEKPSKVGYFVFLYEGNRALLGSRICDTFIEAESSEMKYESVPEVPFKVADTLVVKSFGSIYQGEKYHGRLTPYPIGYSSERKFRITGSKRPAQLIRSEIIDGPLFVVTLLGQKEKIIGKGLSPTDAWQKAVNKLAKSEKIDPSKTKFSGSSLYGLTQPQVFKIIKSMEVEASQSISFKDGSDPHICIE